MKVVLFDIDGTILLTDGAGRRAMLEALEATFGTAGDPTVRYDGKTDMQIVREAMRGAGHDDPMIDERMAAVMDRYLAGLRRELASATGSVRLMHGVTVLLDAIDARDDMVLGLLTGNIVAGAEAKLTVAGIGFTRFRVGAYGSDHEHRHELPAIARDRAATLLGRAVAGEDIVIIGDTPADIACGQTVGARALAVATGHYSVDELAAHAPAAVFADLGDTAAVLGAIEGRSRCR